MISTSATDPRLGSLASELRVYRFICPVGLQKAGRQYDAVLLASCDHSGMLDLPPVGRLSRMGPAYAILCFVCDKLRSLEPSMCCHSVFLSNLLAVQLGSKWRVLCAVVACRYQILMIIIDAFLLIALLNYRSCPLNSWPCGIFMAMRY